MAFWGSLGRKGLIGVKTVMSEQGWGEYLDKEISTSIKICMSTSNEYLIGKVHEFKYKYFIKYMSTTYKT